VESGRFNASRSLAAFVLLAVLAGCHPLPSGDLGAVGPSVRSARQGTVYLVRGWQDLYSPGIDRLAKELTSAGVSTHVFREAQWKDLGRAIEKEYAARATSSGPLVLIGFSYGADDALRISQTLQASKIQPDLVITIDPVTPPKVPANVKVCYNFYETNGIWDVFPWLRGIPLQSAGGPLLNVDLRRDRPDLVEPNTAHSNVAANPKLHREIIARVLEVCVPR